MEHVKTTKERLIEAAAPIFAEKGYRETTVAEISDAAEANIAAVNYHFGDKAQLYSEVWNYLVSVARSEFPYPDDHTEVGAERWLCLFLRSRLECIFSKGTAGLCPMLIHREMNEFTPKHDELLATYLKPNHDRVRAAIRDFIEHEIGEIQLDLLTQNFMGVHISINAGYQKYRNDPHRLHRFSRFQNITPLITQIEAFAIGGLREVKKSLNS
ncbi:TetR/AcrR family transcriptional regulator [Pontiella agarivorans]|uniref:CerR family C-terminal domain-containing protein n=1 Tax=Pontiella agarivorans TaxID=3038953 RepID=A0ABU5MVV5_9BACT|nr:CerR family C-terminal domain-containing protein [Pontiella agarivorans]MDZ8118354.1 CerR family C-terminal domain-containing protein [Pontiella agarivorans]